ncbi:MAG TPA: hypothetical protein VK436_10540 [Methanocella sp.]|nr:hypothetical protein [Methanocella sp.]
MFGHAAVMLIAGITFFALVVAVASAEQNIPLPQTDQNPYHDKVRPILIHLIMINTTSHPLNNINPPENAADLKWMHLFYQYENVGNTQIRGYIKVIFVDSHGNRYQNTNEDYTGEYVLPHTMTNQLYVEIPMPKNADITQFIIQQGFDETVYIIPSVTPTPSPVATYKITPTPSPSPLAPIDRSRFNECLPFFPFAMAGGIAALGIIINRSGIRKK